MVICIAQSTPNPKVQKIKAVEQRRLARLSAQTKYLSTNVSGAIKAVDRATKQALKDHAQESIDSLNATLHDVQDILDILTADDDDNQ